MPNYPRLRVPGGIYAFTLCLADRQTDTLVSHIDAFRAAYADMLNRAPVETLAICILPDHSSGGRKVERLPECGGRAVGA